MVMLFYVLNNEFAAGLFGLVTAYLYTVVTFSSACARLQSAVAVLSVDAIFVNEYFAR